MTEKPLVGWKQIADFFSVSVRTVQGWHKKRSMPLRKTPTGSPMARRIDLDRWMEKTSAASK